ncbi:unnamed protein product [Urochloa humidicola]
MAEPGPARPPLARLTQSARPPESTIGAAFFSQTLAVNGETVKFELWDTAGQERYHSLAPMYYRGAAAAIVVYDITNSASFTRAKKWVQELQAQGNQNTIMALAGKKADLLEGQVPEEMLSELNGEMAMQCSTKSQAVSLFIREISTSWSSLGS